jgi:hypothetical protein
MVEAEVVQGAAQLCRGQRQSVGLQGNRLPAEDGVQRKLDVVANVRVSEFWQRSFNGNVRPKAPAFERVVCDDFNEGSQSAARCFFAILSLVENGFNQHTLEGINGRVAHMILAFI